MAMLNSRLLLQNVYYEVVSGLTHGSQDWSSVRVTTAFPSAEELKTLTLPTIAVGRAIAFEDPLELGSRNFNREDFFTLTLFCKSDGQRDDLGEYVKNMFVETSRNFLDYNDGFPPDTGQTILGKIDFSILSMNPLREPNAVETAQKHKMVIRISTEIVETIT